MANFLLSENGPTFRYRDTPTGPADRTYFPERRLQMSQKALMIAGPLTEDDVTELLNTLRKIGQRTPTQIYRALILDIECEPTMAEIQETIGRVFQPTPDRKPRFLTIPKPEAG
jgi:hypothetical protein